MSWLWHTLFDGTRLCRCEVSTVYRIRVAAERARRRTGRATLLAETLRKGRP